MVHALVSAVNTVDMAGVVERAIQFYRVELAKPTSLWSGAKNALITPSSWILLSLAEFARSAHWSNLKDDEKKEVRAWIKQGVTILLGLQTTAGGWTPLGSKKQLDLRTLPTVTVLWSLAAVLRARSAVELSEDETKACVTAVGRGWDFLMESSTELAGDRWWDPNPHRGWRQKCVGLTLLTYGVLFVVSEALSEVTRGNDTARPGTDRLQQWLKNQHNAIMRQLDHCLHRDLEDMEADGPWDHIVSDQDGTSREIPITYFDWPTSALFALRLSKSAKCYDYSDAAREQVLSNLLANAAKSQEHAYSFRLAMILIASAVDGPILGMT